VCRIVPNCVIKAKSVRTRVFVSDEIEECKDLSGLYYLLAFQKVTDYWQHLFSDRTFCLILLINIKNYEDCALLIIELVFASQIYCAVFMPGLFGELGY